MPFKDYSRRNNHKAAEFYINPTQPTIDASGAVLWLDVGDANSIDINRGDNAMAELFLFPYVLERAEITDMENYLTKKWGL